MMDNARCIALVNYETDEQCPCVDPQVGGRIGNYIHCSECGHSIAAHQIAKRDRSNPDQAQPKMVSNVVTVETSKPVSQPANDGSLTTGQIRAILIANGHTVGERGRIRPELVTLAYSLTEGGAEVPAPKVAQSVASSVKVDIPEGLTVGQLRARLKAHGVPVGLKGRLSPDQIATALTLED